VGDSPTRSAAAHPERLAVANGDRRWTYREFNAFTNRIAHGLAGLGYRTGDVPKAVIVADALPKTSTGKIQKNVVRSEHANHYGG
jgi:non-ribosomal peptide synthetase component E (peptide arylation enzyme)